MLITRLTAPTTDLLDIDTIAQWCRIDPGADPMTIKMLMGSAVDYVRGITGQVLETGQYRIDLDAPAYPTSSISLAGVFPIDAVSSVTIVNADGTTASFTSFVANLYQAVPTITPSVGTSWPTTAVSISIKVIAGYATPADVPMSLRHAVAVMVGAGYDSRSDLDSQTLTTVAALCGRYRRDWMAS